MLDDQLDFIGTRVFAHHPHHISQRDAAFRLNPTAALKHYCQGGDLSSELMGLKDALDMLENITRTDRLSTIKNNEPCNHPTTPASSNLHPLRSDRS
ncbi:hypothetical protein FPZ61_01825 [Synechococcus sp. BSA11S]|nr:hypothetical protein [Synechococcus sp. BSA11S]